MNKKFKVLVCTILLLTNLSIVNAYDIGSLPKYKDYYYQISIDCPDNAINAVINSFTPWQSIATGLNVRLASNSKSSFYYNRGDGVNTIGSVISNARFEAMGGYGANAVNSKQTSDGMIIESDIAINESSAWGNGNSTSYHDYQGIFTHELGHTFGLLDIVNWNNVAGLVPTMYGYSYLSSQPVSYYLRTLEEDDKAGKIEVARLRGF